jgi:CheY-like chemotaxis protein
MPELPPARAGPTILVVDDEPDMREVVRRVLVRRGYHVLLADGAPAALRLVRDHCDEIRLLLTDVRMPGATGAELAAEARQLVVDLRVLYMSGFLAEHVISTGLVEPGAAVVEKPFTPDALVEAVQAALLASTLQ